MSPFAAIRKIFGETQSAMADIAGTKQPTWSRWESGDLEPELGHLSRIRAEALKRKLPWDDTLFFGVPSEQRPVASSSQKREVNSTGRDRARASR